MSKGRMGILGGAALVAVVVVAGAVLLLRGDGEAPGPAPICKNDPPALVISKQKRSEPYPMEIDDRGTYTAEFATSCGDLILTLEPADAPKAVNTVVALVQDRWYNGTPFFRTEDGFAVAGDPSGLGQRTSTPGFKILDEAGPTPDVGSVVFWRIEPDTGGSEFAVITDPAQLSRLPDDVPVIGKVADDASLEVARKIALVPSPEGPPEEKVWILGSRVREGA